MSLAAGRETLEGMAYSLLRIRRYVSFKQLVSKGGRPTSKVYLYTGEMKSKLKTRECNILRVLDSKRSACLM